jgi:hypothetical protein
MHLFRGRGAIAFRLPAKMHFSWLQRDGALRPSACSALDMIPRIKSFASRTALHPCVPGDFKHRISFARTIRSCGLHRPPDGGPGTREGPAWFGLAGCPALPADEKIAASRVPSASVFASLGQGNPFLPLPLEPPAACRSWCSPRIPGITPCLAYPSAWHSQGLSVRHPKRPWLHARYASPSRRLNRCTTALLAEAMRASKHIRNGIGISS